QIRRIELQPAIEHPSPVCCICRESTAKIRAEVAACRCSAGNLPVFSTGGPRQSAKSSKIRRCKPLPFAENRRCKPRTYVEPMSYVLVLYSECEEMSRAPARHQSLR